MERAEVKLKTGFSGKARLPPSMLQYRDSVDLQTVRSSRVKGSHAHLLSASAVSQAG